VKYDVNKGFLQTSTAHHFKSLPDRKKQIISEFSAKMLLLLRTLVRVTKNKNYLVDQCDIERIPLDRHAEVRSNGHSEIFSFRNSIVTVTTVLKFLYVCFETNFCQCCTRLLYILLYLEHVITSSTLPSTSLTRHLRILRISSQDFFFLYLGLAY
jgi:hypothetical protein